MPEPITSLVARSCLAAGGQVFSDALRISVLPARAIVRLQLGARSQKTVNSIKIAGRPIPGAVNTWSGDDPVFCRIAPDTWLLLSALHETPEIIPAVRTGCGRRSYAVTDVSDSLVTLWIEGADAPALLARGCGLDLSIGAFGTPGLHAHAARATARRDPARDVRAVRMRGGPGVRAVALRLARGRLRGNLR